MSFSTKIKFLTLFLVQATLMPANLPAQEPFEKADSIAAHFGESCETISELASRLTESLETESEKARVFYMWITRNVRYDCRKYHRRTRPRIEATSQEELEKKILEYRRAQALKTMKSKKGICEDYSYLFKALCEAAGLEAEVIVGDARDFHKPYRRSHDNPHAWNAVKTEGTWKLLDATWGAGYTDAGVKKFYRRSATGYFFTPPERFVQNHFPEEAKWQLLDHPLSKKDFANQPLIHYGQTEYAILDFSREVGNHRNQRRAKQVWLSFSQVPEAMVVTNRKHKPVKFQQEEIDGKVILTFPASVGHSIVVFGGKSLKKQEWLAMYEL